MIREIQSTVYNNNEHSNENSLAQLLLRQPTKVRRRLTYLWGEDTTDFSFLTMTEAQKGGVVEIDDVEYTWDAMGKFKFDAAVVSVPGGLTYPGLGNTQFDVIFDSNRFPNDWVILAPDKTTRCYIHGAGVPVPGANNQWKYTLQLTGASPTAYVASTNLTAGKHWVLVAPAVPESGSVGNKSVRMAPGKWKGQIGFKRYTMKIQGNISNKVVPIEFSGSDVSGGNGASKSLWINEEMRQFEIQRRRADNFDLYISKYNRDAYGQINLKYLDNNEPVPMSQGIDEMVTEVGNSDTYGMVLPMNKIRNIVTDIFWGGSDTGTMEIVVHCGLGFMMDFDAAVKRDMSSTGAAMFTALGDKKISGTGMFLRYGGGYFNQYLSHSGHLVTLKRDRMFDDGALGELDRLNGNLHPLTGLPMSSHSGIFIDYSVYNGERNVQTYIMKGQKDIMGVVKGLSPIPAAWGSVPINTFAHDKDESSYETKDSRGINIHNAMHCFKLTCTK